MIEKVSDKVERFPESVVEAINQKMEGDGRGKVYYFGRYHFDLRSFGVAKQIRKALIGLSTGDALEILRGVQERIEVFQCRVGYNPSDVEK